MITKINPSLLNKAVRFATKMNQNEETRSSFLSTKRSFIHKDFLQLMEHADHLLIGSFNPSNLDGLIACFKQPHQDYMDCAGPFFTDPSKAKILITEIQERTHHKRHLLFFFDHRHQILIDVIQSLGGLIQGTESQLLLKRGQEVNLVQKGQINEFQEHESYWLKETHNLLFPEGYIPIDDVIKQLDPTRKTLVVYDHENPVGYLILKSYPDFLQRKTIEMVGVLEKYRHSGYGKSLLSYAINKSFQDPSVQSIDLIVENINTHALNLYTHLGFSVKRKNVNMIIPRKE